MLCLIAYYKASVKICNRNALFVTTSGRFVNNVTTYFKQGAKSGGNVTST